MKTELTALRADLRAGFARFERRLALRIATIAATANGILFAALHYLPPAT